MNITTSIKKFIAKHKNFLFILLGVLIALALSMYSGYLREGLETIGEYEYLAPPPADNSFTDATWNTFVPILKQNNPGINIQFDSDIRTAMAKNFTENELKYYIANKAWPIDAYVKKNVITILEKKGATKDYLDKVKQDLDKSTLWGNNRTVYAFVIAPEESKLSPQPLAYQIYMGTAKPPASQQGSSKLTSQFNTGMLDANKRPKPIKLR